MCFFVCIFVLLRCFLLCQVHVWFFDQNMQKGKLPLYECKEYTVDKYAAYMKNVKKKFPSSRISKMKVAHSICQKLLEQEEDMATRKPSRPSDKQNARDRACAWRHDWFCVKAKGIDAYWKHCNKEEERKKKTTGGSKGDSSIANGETSSSHSPPDKKAKMENGGIAPTANGLDKHQTAEDNDQEDYESAEHDVDDVLSSF